MAPAAVRRLLRDLGGCVSALAPRSRSLLRRRAGTAGSRPQSIATLSDRLDIPRFAVEARLRRAAHRLRRTARRTGCDGAATPAGASSDERATTAAAGAAGSTPTATATGLAGLPHHTEPAKDEGTRAGAGTNATDGPDDRGFRPFSELLPDARPPTWFVVLCALGVAAGLALMGREFRNTLAADPARRRRRWWRG